MQDRFRNVNSPVNPISILISTLVGLIYLLSTWLLANSVHHFTGPALATLVLLLGVLLCGIRALRLLQRKVFDRQEKTVFYFLLAYFIFNLGLSLGPGQARVQGASMQPALNDGQLVWFGRWSSGWQLPAHAFPLGRINDTGHLPRLGINNCQRGDIIVFRLEDKEQVKYNSPYYIKRILALPGDQYAFQDGSFVLNGQKLTEPYLKPATHTAARTATRSPLPVNPPDWYYDLPPVFMYSAMNGIPAQGRVPPGGVLVLGDNREESQDSRSFGFIPFALIEGKIIYP